MSEPVDRVPLTEDGVVIPEELRETDGQVIIRTPRATVQHYSLPKLGPTYAIVDQSHFGDADEIWANSPSFDCDILAAAYDAVGRTAPWDYWEERCFRTLKNLPGAVDVEHGGDEHNALDDAVHQAERTLRILGRWNDAE